MKLSHLQTILTIATIALTIGAALDYMTGPVPRPNVSIQFQDYQGETKIFNLVPGTNDFGQLYYGSRTRMVTDDWWFTCLPSSKKFPLKETNALCELYLTNLGPTPVWWISADCEVEAKTPNGWITNVFGHFTTFPNGVGESDNDLFRVYVPIDTIEWRTSGYYSYPKRRFPARDFLTWTLDSLHVPEKSQFADDILDLVPGPDEEDDLRIFSEFFTNKPPSKFTP